MIERRDTKLSRILLFFAGFFSGGGLSLYAIYALATTLTDTNLRNGSGFDWVFASLAGILIVYLLLKSLSLYSLSKIISVVHLSSILLLSLCLFLKLHNHSIFLDKIPVLSLPALFLSLTLLQYILIDTNTNTIHGEAIGFNYLSGILFSIIAFSILGIRFVSGENVEIKFLSFSIAALVIAQIIIQYLFNKSFQDKEIVFNALLLKSEKLEKKAIEHYQLKNIKRYVFCSAFVFSGLLLYASLLISEAYTTTLPVYLHMSVIALFSSILAIITYANWRQNTNSNIRSIIFFISPVVALGYLAISHFIFKKQALAIYLDMYTPPIPILILYVCLAILLVIRIGFEKFALRPYLSATDAQMKLYISTSTIWITEIFAYFFSSLLVFVIAYFFKELSYNLVPVLLAFFAVFWIISIVKLHFYFQKSLMLALDKQQSYHDNKFYCYPLIREMENAVKNNNSLKIIRIFNLLAKLNPILLRKSITKYIASDSSLLQELSLNHAKSICALEAGDTLQKIIQSKYFISSKNAELIREVAAYLEEVKARLKSGVYITHLSNSKIAKERQLGASLCYFEKEKKDKILNKLFFDDDINVVRQAMISAQKSTNKNFQKAIISALRNEALSMAAYAVVIESGSGIVPQLEQAFHFIGQTYEMQKMIIRAYEKIQTENTQTLLFEKISDLNRQIVEDTFNLLSKAEINLPKEKHYIIENEIEEATQQLVWALMAKQKLFHSAEIVDDLLIEALTNQIQHTEERLLTLLSLIFDAHAINQVRQARNSKQKALKAYSQQLLNNSIPEKFAEKVCVMILLSDKNIEYKLEKIKDYIPYEEISEKEIIENLIIEEPQAADNWTKACAIKSYAQFISTKKELDFVLAGTKNKSMLVCETAQHVLHQLQSKKPDLFSTVEKKIHFNTKNPMQLEITSFLMKKSKLFNSLSGSWAKKIAKITQAKTYEAGKETFSVFLSQIPYAIVYSGFLTLKRNEKTIQTYHVGEHLFYIDFISEETNKYDIFFSKETKLFVIEKAGFEVLISEFSPITDCLIQ